MIQGLDHIAVVVRNTEDALKLYRDTLNLSVLQSEILLTPRVRTTYLDLGGAQLQILEPLDESGPLVDWLNAHGDQIHHICLKVDVLSADLGALQAQGLTLRDLTPRIGGYGKPVQFLDPASTRGLLIEVTTA